MNYTFAKQQTLNLRLDMSISRLSGARMSMVEPKIQRCALAFVFNKVLFPFTYPEIADSLKERGYSIALPAEALPSGGRVYVGGPIAKKESVIIIAKDDSKIMQAEGNSIVKVIAAAEEIIEIAKTSFQLDMDKDLSYLELVADLIVRTNVSPIDEIHKFMMEKCNKFSDIMGMETASNMINIVPKGSSPTDLNWFDIRIEPKTTLPKKSYYINIIYRDHDMAKVLDFAGQLIPKTISILKIISEA